MLPSVWSADRVGERLVAAFVTLDRLPRVAGPREPGGQWPGTVTEWADQLAQAELPIGERLSRQQVANRNKAWPSSSEISHMETAFAWLRKLGEDEPGMARVLTMWALRTARGLSIGRLCHEKGWAPRTFFRKRAKGLAIVAESLNMQAVPVF